MRWIRTRTCRAHEWRRPNGIGLSARGKKSVKAGEEFSVAIALQGSRISFVPRPCNAYAWAKKSIQEEGVKNAQSRKNQEKEEEFDRERVSSPLVGGKEGNSPADSPRPPGCERRSRTRWIESAAAARFLQQPEGSRACFLGRRRRRTSRSRSGRILSRRRSGQPRERGDRNRRVIGEDQDARPGRLLLRPPSRSLAGDAADGWNPNPRLREREREKAGTRRRGEAEEGGELATAKRIKREGTERASRNFENPRSHWPVGPTPTPPCQKDVYTCACTALTSWPCYSADVLLPPYTFNSYILSLHTYQE